LTKIAARRYFSHKEKLILENFAGTASRLQISLGDAIAVE